MNRRIARQSQPSKYVLELLRRLVVALADINQTQIRSEPLANPACLRKHLLEARRERAGHRDLLGSGRVHHEPGQQSPALGIVRQMNRAILATNRFDWRI